MKGVVHRLSGHQVRQRSGCGEFCMCLLISLSLSLSLSRTVSPNVYFSRPLPSLDLFPSLFIMSLSRASLRSVPCAVYEHTSADRRNKIEEPWNKKEVMPRSDRGLGASTFGRIGEIGEKSSSPQVSFSIYLCVYMTDSIHNLLRHSSSCVLICLCRPLLCVCSSAWSTSQTKDDNCNRMFSMRTAVRARTNKHKYNAHTCICVHVGTHTRMNVNSSM